MTNEELKKLAEQSDLIDQIDPLFNPEDENFDRTFGNKVQDKIEGDLDDWLDEQV